MDDQLTHVALSCLGKGTFDQDKAWFSMTILDGPMEGEVISFEMRIT